MRRIVIIVLLLAGALDAWSQSGACRNALRALEKEKWEKSRAILEKALRKDSTSGCAHYGFARFYFAPSNPAFSIDSAYVSVNKALQAKAISPTGAGRSQRPDVPDSLILLDLRQQIDSAAFARATSAHSEAAYNFFIDKFVYALQQDTARQLRDEVAWEDALAVNSPEAFAEYLGKYPSSKYADKARARREELLFRINTRDQRLSSFESFLADYPSSPYRHLVEEQILEIFTADGTAEKFSAFLQRFPTGAAARKAMNVLYYLIQETEHGIESYSFWNDSLRNIRRLNASFLVPFIAEKKFGFMDNSGTPVIAATSPSLYDGYRCGNIQEDILVHGNDIISRDGTVIFRGKVTELYDLGYGFVGLETPDCYRVLHKSGFEIGDGCAKDAGIIDGRFIAVAGTRYWTLYSLTGRQLTSGWSEIKSVGRLIGLRKDDKWFLVTTAQLARTADQQPLKPGSGYDDIRSWSDELTWVRKGNYEAVLDVNLRERIPFAEQQLRREVFGMASRSNDCTRLINASFSASDCVEDLKFNSSWVCVKQKGRWGFYDTVSGTTQASYDSIAFTGIFALAYRGDTTRVFFNDSTHLDFNGVTTGFIPGHGSVAFLKVERGGRKTVYDANAVRLFDGHYDAIQHAGGSYFIVERNGKKGLITNDGKQVLPVVFDAIGELEDTRIPLLRSMRFGLYDVTTKKEIRPGYDKKILPYNDDLLVGFKQGKAGIVDRDNKTRVPFEYDGFRFWNDSSAIARKDNKWAIVDLKTGSVLLDEFDEYNVVNASDSETVIIIRRGTEFGVLSSTRGEVISVSYTDLVNIGSATDPLYFAEKHVREASLSVVIYYDSNGNPLRHQALEPDDFDALYCGGN